MKNVELLKRPTHIHRRDVLRGGAALSVCLTVPSVAYAGERITSTIFGGKFEQVYRKTIVEPFQQKTGHEIQLRLGSASQWLTTAMLTKDNPEIDLIWLAQPESMKAVVAGLGIELTEKDIPNIRDVHPTWYDLFRRQGVGLDYASYGIAFRSDQISSAPTSWRDLWKPEFKGRLILPDLATAGGYEVLVMAAKLNGGSEANIEPGFAAMKTLRPSVRTFYRSLPEAAQLFERGEAWIGPYWDGRTWGLKDGGVAMNWIAPKEGALVNTVSYHIAKNSKKQEVSKAFVNFALSVEAQEAFCNAMQYGPVNTKAKLVSPALERVPPLDRLIIPDWYTIEPQMAKWLERFNREVVG